MNTEVKKLWVEALRSGEYKKGVGALRRSNNTYCCLGVLCDLYQKETGKGKWNECSFFEVDGIAKSASLPPAVAMWAGLADTNPRFHSGASAAFVNDHVYDGSCNFYGIADRIEREL